MTATPPNGGQTQPAAEAAPEWATALHTSMKEVGQGIQSLVQIAQASQRAPAPQPSTIEEEAEETLDMSSLELLPRAQFAERLMSSFQSELSKALKPINDRISQSQQSVLAGEYRRDAMQFAKETKDFGEWETEMMKIAEQHPDLPISRIYAIARVENPTKAAEVDKKYAADPEAQPDPKPKGAAKKAPPLALSPASGTAEVKNQRMGAEEAAQDAWERAVAQFGDPFGNS